ncbi:1-deoxy-D-xylulose-5-phosphate synthase [Sphaerobacter thermophilus]|uniref:1-deoxy-D-xylulose-5-phosphate synthase n=1 Tax=Sphaerobacter thermophilus (strain ATCC 49802 / DSM 20745 / KCCM 41009 / NCIMB 13125 / S 6022) TaxID=479434 RepID=D1C4X9_SPHTD|nr:1-deoxy-D-xylulose-5-phosphate synthase [Sphaerobacter thermophilus]ACZ39296.1 deoxyxylulose-5-phosphate synthase [Sphaerobacter thermophilus DSM 20745]
MLLERVDSPEDLKALSLRELEQLAAEIRQTILDIIVGKTGGHFASNLGSVELAIALHYVFNSPQDKIVWDVGHQAYPHKLITGRRDRFHTIRQPGGLSGFLQREESPHDHFGAGHASTSISAALGMAVAGRLKGERFHTVAVIGDGALTGGMAYEALNNAGSLQVPLIVVLNDNEMSIAPNVGALPKYLSRIRTDERYTQAKIEVERLLHRMPQGDWLLELGKRMKDGLKEVVYHTMIWEELGFTYVGPVDGHNLRDLIETLQQVREIDGPVFVHAVTVKGKGYEPAENDPFKHHAASIKIPGAPPSPPKYQDVFGETLTALAREDERIVAITAAMPDGTGLLPFAKEHPKRFFDVGIAEQHAVTFAAGLATQGLRPVAAIYSTFLQRAFDQVVHDVCIQKLPVVLAMDRAGFAGEDGRTHHGLFDIAYLRCLPNMVLMAPKDENELRHMLKTAILYEDGPIALRYPRGAGVGVPLTGEPHPLPIGRGEVLREGDDITIVALGTMVLPAERAADILAEQGIHATVINARFVKPLDEELILSSAQRTGHLLTVEEAMLAGGFGSAVLELLAREGLRLPVTTLGVPDRIFDHAPQGVLRKQAGLDAETIAARAAALLGARPADVPVAGGGA